MSPAAQKRKLQLIERIIGLTDLKQIKAVEAIIEEVLPTRNLPFLSPEEEELVREGEEDFAAGRVHTHEEFMAAIRRGLDEGATSES